jgi:hypothetical protein
MGCTCSHEYLVRERFVWQWNDGWRLMPISLRAGQPGFANDVRVLEVWRGTRQGRDVTIEVTDYAFATDRPAKIWETTANRQRTKLDADHVPILSLRDDSGEIIGIVRVSQASTEFWWLERITTVGASHNLVAFRGQKPEEFTDMPALEKPQSFSDYKISRARFASSRSNMLDELYASGFSAHWPLVVLHSREVRHTPEWAQNAL